MKFHSSFCILSSALVLSFFHSTSLAAICPPSSGNVSDVSSCTVEGNASDIQLNFISGFDLTQSTLAIGGNNGQTVGEQRRLTYIKAAEIFAAQIESSQVIVVDAQFDALECDATSAVLGSAGASSFYGYASESTPIGALADTLYPISLTNALSNVDNAVEESDIQTSFNANLGASNCLAGRFWYYGFDDNTGQLTGFLTVLLHEVTHGLGFASLIDPTTGEKVTAIREDESTLVVDDIYSNFLYIKSEGQTWQQLGTSETDNLKRQQSAISDNNLFWNGTNANTQAIGQLTDGFSDNDNSNSFTSGDRIQIYAPNPLESGSSVSHFDPAASPNELMEPNLSLNACDTGLALGVLKDLGWSVIAPIKPDFYLNINCNQVIDGQVFNNVFKGDTIKITPVSDASNYTYTLTYEGENANNLVTGLNNGFLINTQSSGEFAGTYILTVGNGTDPDITITINRPLRVVWSSDALLNNERYTLTIEGGAANSVYDLTQSQTNVINFLDEQNQDTTFTTATNNAADYNPAVLNISSNTVISPLSVTTTVQSQSNTYADVSDNITVYPSIVHSFTIKDASGTSISNVSVALPDSTLINAVGLATNYVSNTVGQLSVNLPNTDDAFIITFNKAGYNEQTLTINASQTSHQVTLSSSNATPETQSTPETPDEKLKFGSSGGALPNGVLVFLAGLLLWRRKPNTATQVRH